MQEMRAQVREHFDSLANPPTAAGNSAQNNPGKFEWCHSTRPQHWKLFHTLILCTCVFASAAGVIARGSDTDHVAHNNLCGSQ